MIAICSNLLHPYLFRFPLGFVLLLKTSSSFLNKYYVVLSVKYKFKCRKSASFKSYEASYLVCCCKCYGPLQNTQWNRSLHQLQACETHAVSLYLQFHRSLIQIRTNVIIPVICFQAQQSLLLHWTTISPSFVAPVIGNKLKTISQMHRPTLS